MTMLKLSMITLVVPDYDEAIAFYERALGFEVVEDTNMGKGKRWVVVAAADGSRILLAKAADEAQEKAVGNQTGGRVGFFLETDDFAACYERFRARGVAFEENPRSEAYGTVAVFTDPFGNRWDLIEHRKAA